jgi:hydrogenase-1 operon protein HyaE
MTIDTPSTAVEPPAITRLVDHAGALRLDASTVDAFAGAGGAAALFFTADPQRFREVTDLAVILPEIRKASSHPFRIGVLPPPLAQARAATYGVQRWPALVFLRDGLWLGNIEGLRDWADYLPLVHALLDGPTRPLPPKVYVVAGATACR